MVTGGSVGGAGTIRGNTVIKGAGQIDQRDPLMGIGYGKLTVDGNLTLARPEADLLPRVILSINNPGSGATFHDAALANYITANGPDASGYFADVGDGYINANYNVDLFENQHDQLAITGTLTMEAGATILLENLAGYEFMLGDVFNLMDWAGLNVGVGGPDRVWDAELDLLLPELGGSSLLWDTSLFNSHGVIFVSAPEPGRILLLVLGLGSLILRRRRSGRF
jgi:hypothetical protein